jgi:hypothetical protein
MREHQPTRPTHLRFVRGEGAVTPAPAALSPRLIRDAADAIAAAPWAWELGPPPPRERA